jgi:hypothetical protein
MPLPRRSSTGRSGLPVSTRPAQGLPRQRPARVVGCDSGSSFDQFADHRPAGDGMQDGLLTLSFPVRSWNSDPRVQPDEAVKDCSGSCRGHTEHPTRSTCQVEDANSPSNNGSASDDGSAARGGAGSGGRASPGAAAVARLRHCSGTRSQWWRRPMTACGCGPWPPTPRTRPRLESGERGEPVDLPGGIQRGAGRLLAPSM